MAYPILGTPSPQFLDSSGSPYASGTITTLDPVDDSVKASYGSADDADTNTSGTSGDITLDASGRPSGTQYWGKDGEDYKVVIKDSSGTTILTMDDIKLPAHSRRAAVTLGVADATPTIAESNIFLKNDTAAITDFDDGQVGDEITIFHTNASAGSITDGTPIHLHNRFDMTMRSGDSLTLRMIQDQIWEEVARKHKYDYEVLSSGKTLVEGDSGQTYFLNSAGGFTVTLPTAAAGLKFTFIVQTAPTTSYIIALPSADGTLFGVSIDVTATKIGTVEDAVNFDGGVSVVGDRMDLISDGTNWYVQSYSGAVDGVTFTT